MKIRTSITLLEIMNVPHVCLVQTHLDSNSNVVEDAITITLQDFNNLLEVFKEKKFASIEQEFAK